MAIQQKHLSDLNPSLRQLVDRAQGAIRGRNFGYAVEILRRVLKEEPGCSEVRRILRGAQIDRVGGEVGVATRLVGQLKTFVPVGITGPGLLRKGKIAEALDLAERALEADPTAVATLHFLHRAALAGGLESVAVEALELCRRFHPTHEHTARTLVGLYKGRGEVVKALHVLRKFSSARPNDLGLQRELKELTATAAMEKGKWEDAESYRDVIRDKEQARTLEQQERVAARDEETLADMIADAERAVNEQETVTHHKRLADLYRRHGDYDEALEHYGRVIELSGTLDPVVDDAVTGVLMERFDEAIREWEAYAEENPDNRAEADEEVRQIKAQREQTRLERYLERVKRYPNDARYHFELGKLHFDRQEIDEALAQFQASRRNPKLAPRSLYYSGLCMAEKGLADMAVEQMEAALEAAPERMNRERMEMTYDLARLYGDVGDQEKALQLLKGIYAVNVNYRDVGRLIEAHYRDRADA